MELSPNGELLKWIKKLGSFDEECTVRGLEAADFLDRTAIALDSGSRRACVVDLYGMRDRVRIEKKEKNNRAHQARLHPCSSVALAIGPAP